MKSAEVRIKNMGTVEAMNKNWKNSMKLIVLLTVLVLLRVFSFLPASAQENRDFTVSGGSEGTDWTYTNDVLTFIKGGSFTIGMAEGKTETDHQIRIDTASISNDTENTGEIKLILNNLIIERNAPENGGSCINATNVYSTVNVILEILGQNKIINNHERGGCIRMGGQNVTVTGNGTLKLDSKAIGNDGEWSVNSFTLNSPNVKIESNRVSISASERIYIKQGSISIESHTPCFYTLGQILIDGGSVNISATKNNPCIQITSQNPGLGLVIKGGNIKIKTDPDASPYNTGVVVISNNLNNSVPKFKKDIVINTSENVTIDGYGKRAACVLFRNTLDYIAYQSDFSINNGKFLMKNCGTGFLRNLTTTSLNFNGGETEILTSSNALYNIVNSSYIKFAESYRHINYQGDTLGVWDNVSDDKLINDSGMSKKYLLITPINSIEYDLNKGLLPSGKSNPATFSRFDFPFTLNNPVRYNSEFLGWTGSNGDTPETNVIIQTIGDKNYTANWKQIAAGVSISAGAGMSKTDESGQAAQVLQENAPMTDVVYTANDGYYFPEDYAADVPSDSGITVRRDNLGQITVSGPRSLTADVHVILPAATEKEKKSTPTTAEFSASGADSGTLSGVKPGMQYSLDGGNTWTDISAESVDIPSGVTTENGILVREKGNGTTTLDSDPQIIEITKAEKPAGIKSADCTTSDNNDGKLIGVTDGMEYKPEGSETWIPVTGSEVTGLVPGTYQIRVTADGMALASDPVDMTVIPWTAPGQMPAPTFSHPSGTYGGTQHVTISCTEEGAAIHYTTDGTEPTTASPVYSEPITVKIDTVIRAFAVKDGMSDSPAAEAEYTIYVGKQISTDISFSSTYDGEPHGVVISVTDPAEGAVIRYGTSEGTYDLEESPTITDAGSLTVYYQVTAEEYETLTGSVTLTVIKPEGSDDPSQCYPPCSP